MKLYSVEIRTVRLYAIGNLIEVITKYNFYEIYLFIIIIIYRTSTKHVLRKKRTFVFGL